MAAPDAEPREIHAKIVYFGAEGAGTTTNLERIHRKLKREHRGDLVVMRTDGGAAYEHLPVQLGAVRGFSTSIHVYSAPVGPENAAERRRLLDGVDGVALVADLRPERHDATVSALDELREHLASYGRTLDDVRIVVQYNHRDGANENALDRLHRRLGLSSAMQFEAVAIADTGVLQTLSTLSKLIVSDQRRRVESGETLGSLTSRSCADVASRDESQAGAESAARATPATPLAPSLSICIPEKGFRLAPAGDVECVGGELRIPIELIDETTGRHVELCLRLGIGAD